MYLPGREWKVFELDLWQLRKHHRSRHSACENESDADADDDADDDDGKRSRSRSREINYWIFFSSAFSAASFKSTWKETK